MYNSVDIFIMLIEGRKNLEFLKRTLIRNLEHSLCKIQHEESEYWKNEITETELMLDAVEHNLKRHYDEEMIHQSVYSIINS